MTILTWIKKELGIVSTTLKAVEPSVLAWATNFLSGITPVIKEAATDGVLAAVAVPGDGAVKAAAALAAASADLLSKGVPIVEADLKAAIQIAYNALPASLTGSSAAAAIETAATNEVTTLATSVAGTFVASTPAAS